MYNPLLDKKPYGASVVNKETLIKFPLNSELGVKRVFVVLRQIFGEGGEINGQEIKYELTYKNTINNVDNFEISLILKAWGIYKYRFEGIYENGDYCFFGRSFNGEAIMGDWLPEWQLTVTKCDIKTPNWAKQGVIYQIFADRFCRVGEPVFNKKGRLHSIWHERPDIQEPGKDYRADDFYGGNIKGIISKLDYIKSLGVTCIYLSPIFESGSNHRYDTGNYLKIDELFGREEEFKELINKAKEKDIGIILDGVFNHTGSDSIYFNRFNHYDSLGAYQSKESPYYDWYYFKHFPNDYAAWWGSSVVPTVNKDAKGYQELILGKDGVIEKWGKLGISGWRLDVVDELPIDFTTKLCKKIKDVDSDALIVGEVWEDASTKISYSEWRPYFMGEQLDSVMNYPFKEAINALVMGGDKKEFIDNVTKICENYPKENLDTLMNLIDSHDTVRALTSYSGAPPPNTKLDRANSRLSNNQYEIAKVRLKLASGLQYILPGVPCVFYGDEVGMQGYEDPLNRGTYPWGFEDQDLLNHYKSMGNIRTKYKDYFVGERHFELDGDLIKLVIKSGKGTLLCLINTTFNSINSLVNGYDIVLNQKTEYTTIDSNSIRIFLI